MGQKAKNAGKKPSKVCDKPASAKSRHCKGHKLKRACIFHNFTFENGDTMFDKNEWLSRGQRGKNGAIDNNNYKNLDTANQLKKMSLLDVMPESMWDYKK